MSLPPISSDSFKGDTTMADNAGQRVELQEYEYYVGHLLCTAQMTPEQAEKVGAVPAGSGQLQAPQVGGVANTEAQRTNSTQAEADANGTDGENTDAVNKARETRNRRAR